MRKMSVVVGLQYGSEAKGHVTQRLVQRYAHTESVLNIRVAGPNAGHTAYDSEGRAWAMRQVPVGFVDPLAHLAIGPGSEIDFDVLLHEIMSLRGTRDTVAGRLTVDSEATIITPAHKERESALVGKIGSTGKGIGAARADRIMRQASRIGDNQQLCDILRDAGVRVADTTRLHRTAEHVIIEGTQGYGLGLHAGHYPQTTSSDCRAVDFIAMAGLSPWQAREVEIWGVARVYPIRVAGNSGPMHDEQTWSGLGLPEELTTVTKKVRRVGTWDDALVAKAIEANGRNKMHLAVMMLDQMFPEVANQDFIPHKSPAHAWLRGVAKDLQIMPEIAGTGPNKIAWL